LNGTREENLKYVLGDDMYNKNRRVLQTKIIHLNTQSNYLKQNNGLQR